MKRTTEEVWADLALAALFALGTGLWLGLQWWAP